MTFPTFPRAAAGHSISNQMLCSTHHVQMLNGNQNDMKVFYFQLQLSKIATPFKNHSHYLPRLKKARFHLSHCSTCIVSKSHFQLISQCTATKENKIIKSPTWGKLNVFHLYSFFFLPESECSQQLFCSELTGNSDLLSIQPCIYSMKFRNLL